MNEQIMSGAACKMTCSQNEVAEKAETTGLNLNFYRQGLGE